MKRTYSRCKVGAWTGRDALRGIDKVQAFPKDGELFKNLSLPLQRLKGGLCGVKDKAYSYVVTSVKLPGGFFEQRGSAPNFQGGLLTLCTCKHQMRASKCCDDWENSVWLAGFTSRTLRGGNGNHWLFYLAKVQSAHESHADLWASISRTARRAKAAHVHYLGDVFEPKKPSLREPACYLPSQYYAPTVHAHRQPRKPPSWRNDIDYRHATKFGRPAMLVADPHLTFIWEEPMIFLMNHDHCRNYLKWSSLQNLIVQLQEAK